MTCFDIDNFHLISGVGTILFLSTSEQRRHLLRSLSQGSKTACKHDSSSYQHSPQTSPIDANVESHHWLPIVATGGNPILGMMEPNRVPDDDYLAFALGDELHKCVVVTADPQVLSDSNTLPFHILNHCKCYCQSLTVLFPSAHFQDPGAQILFSGHNRVH
jgi:hypothetical protein